MNPAIGGQIPDMTWLFPIYSLKHIHQITT